MELAHRWIDRNLTRMELIVACTILTVFIGIFLRYMLHVYAAAEKTMVNMTIVNINSALKYHAATAVMRGEELPTADISAENPFLLLERTRADFVRGENKMEISPGVRIPYYVTIPENYIGHLYDPDPSVIEPGNWYYDLYSNTLNYRVRNALYYRGELDGSPVIRFQVTVDYDDRNGNAVYDRGIDEYIGMQLKRFDNYTWLD